MVNVEIPPHYTNSPAGSLSGTPHLTINKDITALDLDSSNAFEGPEKLLEVWFSPSEKALPASASPLGLKAVSQDSWKEMLDLVNCKVLSVIDSKNVDAYLLSESSMFVFPHKLVLKTCGTTTLLLGLSRMLEIAALEAGFPHVKAGFGDGVTAAATPYRVFYSRKNFLFPTQQRGPHRSWRDEVRYLDKMFLGGSAYMIGKMNGDHWYLYITGPRTQLTPPATPEEQVFQTPTQKTMLPEKLNGMSLADAEPEDETLEILMIDLEEDNARQFYLEDASNIAQDNARRAHLLRKDAFHHLGVIPEANGSDPSISGNTVVNGGDDPSFDVFAQTSSDHSGYSTPADEEPLTCAEELSTEGHTLGSVVTENCGLADVYPTSKYPDARIDSYLFTPCGYSANGVVPMPGDGESTNYWTVHVTPEPQCSYASFETNVPTRHTGRQTVDVVQQVVGIFKPGRFSVTLFEAKDGEDQAYAKNDKRMDHIKGYRRVDRIVHDLEGYELVFRYFERNDWEGGAPRLGEPSP
ncbi:S-adenosylmethionine decarboxylase proenzyme [Fulvia fulva]|uniref:S-adenosylmethionine decarboxylase proenzyme n=1 Tax=Passalora fulva TaxID=5499 RepID=A0A9Q8PAD4_PASFU|nr:S-adenosylmethionine decarboxylase proenzyme [Fulvia fulva]KAK4621668.1 S-adenosylmethionine decarboxylase proenzyme [Fulvia fulva]KAK4622412.1 S-adenosylmethionine decarboxylase proenzyme [Fulvia fulva]UJO18796.1 S-adenosylmethionine decarboxylase proenzyme [Fulvia fulva]WPV15892.1 S-adenosylmethionine decarboxylase proenzyme [Fulvia fulva]WPV31211.1 S-adenosylmethionine decarboxylase proenzyme [Fulvia fulva]